MSKAAEHALPVAFRIDIKVPHHGRVMNRIELLSASENISIQDEVRTRLSNAFFNLGVRALRRAVLAPPGLRLWKLAEFFCTRKAYDSVFVPLLADFHHEYFECLSTGQKGKALWMRGLYLWAFLKSAGLNVSMKFLREAWARFRKA
jgi:hypothetical protein